MFTLMNYGSPFERRSTFDSMDDLREYVSALRKSWNRGWEPLALWVVDAAGDRVPL